MIAVTDFAPRKKYAFLPNRRDSQAISVPSDSIATVRGIVLKPWWLMTSKENARKRETRKFEQLFSVPMYTSFLWYD